MTPEQYLNQLVNQYVDGGQCIGLASTYSRKYLGTPDFFNHDAKDVFNYAPDSLFTKILNNPQDYSQHPEEGDIIIWNAWNGNPYGHIAVCSYTSNGSNFVSYDQNWKVGTPVHRQLHDYGSVKGWLRPKNRFWLVDPQIAIDAAKEAARTAEVNRVAAEKAVADAKAVADKIEADRLARETQAKLELENAQAKLVEEARKEAERLRVAEEDRKRKEEASTQELKDKETSMLTGKRTYIADALLVLVAVQGLVPQLTFIPVGWTATIVTILGALVATFRFLATK